MDSIARKQKNPPVSGIYRTIRAFNFAFALVFFRACLLRKTIVLWCVLFLAAALYGCATRAPVEEKPAFKQIGMGSYYADRFHGHRTANGERYDRNAMTAAHLTLPFGTKVRVQNTRNNRSVIVRINDRGPYIKGRIIDLSYAAAQQLGILKAGVVRVRVTIAH